MIQSRLIENQKDFTVLQCLHLVFLSLDHKNVICLIFIEHAAFTVLVQFEAEGEKIKYRSFI